MIKDSGERTEFGTGAVRDMSSGKGRFDLLPWYGIWEVAKHCEQGADKYGERNVDKGIPVHSFIDSAFRHLMKYNQGWEDEDHLRACAWNVLWALNQRTTHPELDDRYYKGVRGDVICKVDTEEHEQKGCKRLDEIIERGTVFAIDAEWDHTEGS